VLGGVSAQAQGERVEVSAKSTKDQLVEFVQPPVGEAPVRNTTGHVDLIWSVRPDSAPEPAAYELQGAGDKRFSKPKRYYSGKDSRSFLSGLAGGTHYFRVRSLSSLKEDAGAGAWSEVLAVEVDYVDSWKVFTLMAVGLVCLLATVLIIIRGSLRTGDYAKDVF